MITTKYANQIADEIVKAQSNGLHELGLVGLWFLEEKISSTSNLELLSAGATEQVQRLIAKERETRGGVL